jgi:hypothetical protein
MDLFERFEHETAKRLGFEPTPDRDPVRALVRNALGE